MDEETVLLEEQLVAAQADIGRLQEQLAQAEALAVSRQDELAGVRQQLEAERSSLAEGQAETDLLRQAVDAAEAKGRAAAQRYRELVLAREPELPAEMVSGESVEEIDASLEQARQTVSQVRQRLEAQAQALRVSPGAPVRGEGEPAALSPSEKIRRGLQRAQ